MKIRLMLFMCFCSLLAFGQGKNEIIKNGMDCYPFTYKDVNDKEVSLSDLKGKYVLIDVWATWCSACVAEQPYLQKLEKEMKGKNIHFVSVSIDAKENVAKWKKMVNDKKLSGIQFVTAGDFGLMMAFGIRTIPRFILLDPEGKVIESNMTRPREEVTLKTLNSLKGI